MPRHFLSLLDLTPVELRALLDRARAFKRVRGTPEHPRPLAGKSIALLMEKASTRTRISFEVAVVELGGYPLGLAGRDLQIGRNEPLDDTARIFSRYLHAVVIRTFGHERLETLAAASDVPIINALTDKFHPCQLLADLMTVLEHRAAGFDGLRVAWIGDGNNMAHSWINAAALLGFELRLACPERYMPAMDVVATARARGAQITLTHDVAEAARGVDVVTTDVWASMGQEDEAEARRSAFRNYCVTSELMAVAAPGAIFLHCLPAHRGEEVSAEVIDGPASRVWDEAENRLHSQKALLELICGHPVPG
jgi:ornithine carbamoyltransferase